MTQENVNMEEVVEHTKGPMEDRDLTKGKAASRMAEQLNEVSAADIIREM